MMFFSPYAIPTNCQGQALFPLQPKGFFHIEFRNKNSINNLENKKIENNNNNNNFSPMPTQYSQTFEASTCSRIPHKNIINENEEMIQLDLTLPCQPTTSSVESPRHMTVQCVEKREGHREYYKHYMVDDSGRRIYQLCSNGKKTLEVLKHGNLALTTNVRFPGRHYLLVIPTAATTKMVEFEFRSVRFSHSSIMLDGVTYRPFKTKIGGMKQLQWKSSAINIPLIVQSSKTDLTINPGCPEALEVAVIFATCLRCLNHDNSR